MTGQFWQIPCKFPWGALFETKKQILKELYSLLKGAVCAGTEDLWVREAVLYNSAVMHTYHTFLQNHRMCNIKRTV
jgi:hypothetical protein